MVSGCANTTAVSFIGRLPACEHTVLVVGSLLCKWPGYNFSKLYLLKNTYIQYIMLFRIATWSNRTARNQFSYSFTHQACAVLSGSSFQGPVGRQQLALALSGVVKSITEQSNMAAMTHRLDNSSSRDPAGQAQPAATATRAS